jgi:hypothetical protein
VKKVWLQKYPERLLLAQAIFQAKPFHVQYPTLSTPVTLHTYSPMKMEHTQCSETLAFKLQTPGNNPEESIRHSKQGESLISGIALVTLHASGALQIYTISCS